MDESKIHFLRPVNYFLFDPTWAMVREFLQENSVKLYYERLLIFDDWSEHNPIITPATAKDPREAEADFFKLPKERRNIPLNYTDQYENQADIGHKQIRRSPYENSDRDEMKIPMDLDQPNIGRGFHISVRELDHQD